MESKKIKTVKGYTALARELAKLGVSEHARDNDVLREIRTLPEYPQTPYSYTGGTTAYWKGYEGKYYSWPEVSQLKYEIHQLID